MNYITIGVDPGSKSGAIAIIKDGHLSIFGMDRKSEQQIERAFYDVLLDKGLTTQIFAVIERVNAVKGQGLSSTFKFGVNYGFLRACLVANRIPFRDYLPKEWQKHYSMVRKKSESGPQWKERLLNVAQNLYPSVSIPLYAGDAVLLSHFAKDLLTN
jgi:crossover junction endodeoxyribonuclease RuvC